MVSFSEIWNTVLNLGIRESMPFSEKRGIKAINLIAVLGFPTAMLISFLIVFLFKFSYVVMSLGICSTATVASLPLLNYYGRHLTAKLLLYIVITSNILIDAIIVGDGVGLEYTGFCMLMGAFSFSKNEKELRRLALISVLCSLGPIILYAIRNELWPIRINFAIQFLFGLSVNGYGFLMLNILKSQTDEYEKVIEEKNNTLIQQTQQLELQHESLSKLNTTIREKNRRVGQKNSLITDSLNYAKRIQLATLPTSLKLRSLLGESFILFKPKDIVSGDFYWAENHEDRLYFAVADCTGHGVPGAFMSLLGINALRQIIREPGCKMPSCILGDLYERIAEQLGTELKEESMLHEGMDIALCELDRKNKKLRISLAGRSAYFVRNCQVTEFKGSRAHIRRKDQNFEKFDDHELDLLPNDTLYLFTDGLTDQFDASDKKRFSLSRFKNLLPEIFYVDMQGQLELIRNEHEKWKGHTPQTDDILVLGFRFTNEMTMQ